MSRGLLLAGRIALGLVLLYAGYAKLRQPWISFAATIEGYKILPPDAVIFVSRTLPWFEVALGSLLLLGVWLRWVAAIASALLLVFFAILVRSYALGMDIDCGCFGPGEKLSWKTLLRDGLLVGVSVATTIGAFFAARRPVKESTAS